MIIGNAATALLYLFYGAPIREHYPDAPDWMFPALIALGVVNVACAVAIFKWKKWGFYGFVVTSIVTFAINLMIGLGIIQAVLGLFGVVLLFGVLQIGKERKGWTQLE